MAMVNSTITDEKKCSSEQESLSKPATPCGRSSLKDLKSLVSNVLKSEDGSENYHDIMELVGIPVAEQIRIDLATFRRAISESLNVDPSFLYKRVFNAFDSDGKGCITPKQFVSCLSTMLEGPFQAQVSLALRVYAKGHNDNLTITKQDAISSIVESFQLSSPRSRNTLTSMNRERAHKLAEDLVDLVFPKLDLDNDGVISKEEFSRACYLDPTLIQCFGQFLPMDSCVVPEVNIETIEDRPRSSCSRKSFENINYLEHSPTMRSLWGKSDTELGRKRSERLEPIPLNKKSSTRIDSSK